MQILIINGGSSSVKWALFDGNMPPRKSLAGRVTGIGSSQAQFTVKDGASVVVDRTLQAPTQQVAVAELTDRLKVTMSLQDVQGALRLPAYLTCR